MIPIGKLRIHIQLQREFAPQALRLVFQIENEIFIGPSRRPLFDQDLPARCHTSAEVSV